MGGAQISVGRLGVITEVDLRIVPQRMFTRTVTSGTFDELVASVEAVASAYSAALAANASAAEVSTVLAPLDMMQVRPTARVHCPSQNACYGVYGACHRGTEGAGATGLDTFEPLCASLLLRL